MRRTTVRLCGNLRGAAIDEQLAGLTRAEGTEQLGEIPQVLLDEPEEGLDLPAVLLARILHKRMADSLVMC